MRPFSRPILFTLFLALGCVSFACGGDDDSTDGGDDENDDEWADGDRLKVRERAFAGSEPVPIGFRDEELAADCFPDVAADGELRCLPGGFAFADRYSSDDCSEESAILEVLATCGPSEPVVSTQVADSCPTRFRVYRLGTAHEGPIYLRNGDGCFPADRFEGFEYYEPGEEVPPDELVAVDSSAAGDARLQPYADVAEDGARGLSFNFRDTELDEDCTFSVAADGSDRCLPAGDLIFSFDTYADEGCTQPVMLGSSCVRSDHAFSFDEAGCETRLPVYEVGAPLGDVPLYEEFGGLCEPLDFEYEGAVRPIGDEVPPSALVGGSPLRTGNGRVQARWLELEDGSRVFRGWWDSQLDMNCFVLALPDGSAVCAPNGSMGLDEFTYFSDAACTDSLTVATGGPDCAEADPIAVVSSASCPQYQFFGTAELVDDVFFFDQTGTCRALTEEERSSVRALGESIDPTTFEHATGTSARAAGAEESLTARSRSARAGRLNTRTAEGRSRSAWSARAARP